ncbi:hypothetical protein HPB49_024871 [Dermacentor silvarum]|uniref:Uncharacterized protein n=1 Tax=Dermacentor silvarum TaxID=543639 RepID=A0ACB8DHH9_DERSI|nr:hypothetical protein HPB49_024871 [Dermacentor silvarum]
MSTLPPLPKGDLKVVIRPTRGLALKQYPNHAISAAIVMSCQTSARVEGKYVVRPHKGSNILIVSTPHEETADEICQLTHLKLANQAHPVRAYVPFSPQTIRGVIHGLDPNNTRETLMKGLWVRDTRIKILDARILGTSTTALLTIDGPHLPRLVYHGGCEYPCHQFRPARQFCQMCMQSGHRPDLCPNPNTPVCRQCGIQNPPTSMSRNADSAVSSGVARGGGGGADRALALQVPLTGDYVSTIANADWSSHKPDTQQKRRGHVPQGILESARAATAQIPFLPNHAAATAQEPRVMNLPPAPTREQLHNHTPPLATTHLLGLEEPPVDLEWQWAGCNRVQGARKGGGVGILWRSDAVNTWTKLEGPCNEHVVGGLYLGHARDRGGVYLSVDRGQNVENQGIIQCIAEDVGRWRSNREVLVMGDFNGHVQLIDHVQDHNGGLMLQLVERLSLEVANLRPDCIGETTWSARNSRSCIDYALTSPKLTAHMTRVHVDKSGQFSLGSDHVQPHRPDILCLCQSSTPDRSSQRVAERSGIHMRQTTYAEFIDELHHTMRRYEKRVQSRGGTKRKAWWDQQAPRPTLRDAAGEEVTDAEEHLTAYMQQLYNSPIPVQQNRRRTAPQRIVRRVTRIAIDRVISHIGSHSAKGLDEISPGVVKQLGQRARETMASIFTGIVAGDPVPEDWLRGRVIKSWMNAWAVKSGTLTELQNGFRQNRRVEDKLFVLMQCIEIARKGIASVPHNLLLPRMDDLGMPPVWIDLLRRLYTSNTVETRFGETRARPVEVKRGLKQGYRARTVEIGYGLEDDAPPVLRQQGDHHNGADLRQHAGALRTLDYRSRFDCAPKVQAAVCRVCDSERETAEHLVLNCAKLSPTPKEGTTMPQALGFLDAEGGRCFEGVATTKARLERWWRAVKQSRTVPGVV